MRSAIGMAAMLVLTACGTAEAPKNEAAPTPTPTPGPKVGGVDLNKPVRASGAEWTLDIAPGRLTFQQSKSPAPIELYPRSPAVTTGHARYVTETPEGEAVTIDLTAKTCKGAPLTAQLSIGTRVLNGCAQAR